ncbi:MAG: hypothetical protein IPK87_15600 [Planctomycetes bacterium]|nr:hypothetical protein [Planctomycetota bacterium]
MRSALLKRFAGWIGSWSGPVQLPEGRDGVMQLDITPIFEGDALEVGAIMTDQTGQVLIGRGIGFWSLERDGRVCCVMYGGSVGFTELLESPDDPDALALSGPLGDGRTLTVMYSQNDGGLQLTSSTSEGYTGSVTVRNITQLRRRAESEIPPL